MSKEVKRWDELKLLAEKATPGPWRMEDDEDSAAGAVYIVQDKPDWQKPIARLYGWHDQNYLEVADPTTILELLAERDALLAELDALKEKLDSLSFETSHQNISYALRDQLLGQLAGDHEPEELLCVEDFYSWLANAIDNIRADYRKAEGSKPTRLRASAALQGEQP